MSSIQWVSQSLFLAQAFFAPPSPDEGDGELIDWREAEDPALEAEPEGAADEAASGENPSWWSCWTVV